MEGLTISKIGFDLINHEDNFDLGYDVIEEISMGCKFSNCTHTNEPHCAIKKLFPMNFLQKK